MLYSQAGLKQKHTLLLCKNVSANVANVFKAIRQCNQSQQLKQIISRHAYTEIRKIINEQPQKIPTRSALGMRKSFSVVTLTNEPRKISLAGDLNVELNILEFIMADSKDVVNKVIIAVKVNVKRKIIFRILITKWLKQIWGSIIQTM